MQLVLIQINALFLNEKKIGIYQNVVLWMQINSILDLMSGSCAVLIQLN